MTPFKAPTDDILFTLEHVAGAPRLPQWDGDLAREVIRHFASFAESEIAPLDEAGDREGCRIEGGRVRMPAGLAAAYRAYREQGWQTLTLPERFGGQDLPFPLLAAVSEIFTGACHSLQMVTGLVPGTVRTLLEHGSEEQQDRLIPPLADGSWLSTMCLTEPGAGSDLSAIRTRAEESGGGWRISGEKIFISGGDQDLSEGILHLVLARTGPAEAGTRGLGLFAVTPHPEGGQADGVRVERIEEKLGLHASPTCQMVFDGARAELIGAPGEGLKVMFTMMNHARLDVALQGVAHAARASQLSRAYASERRQGRGSDGAPATIDAHADVARMLETQEAAALGGRALCHIASVMLEAEEEPALLDFLTPVCKVLCTEAGIGAADLGIQVHGGYGYLREYRIEQVWRDARITAIYEGANGIHARALATRLLRIGNGASADAFRRFAAGELEGARAGTECLALWDEARGAILGREDPGEAAWPFMKLTADLAFMAAWERIARAAERSADPARLDRLAGRVRRTQPHAARMHHALALGAG